MKKWAQLSILLTITGVACSACNGGDSKWVADVNDADLPRLEAKMKELGVPTRESEFQAFIAVPDDQNGAVDLEKAINVQRLLKVQISAIEKRMSAYRSSKNRADLDIKLADFAEMKPLFDAYDKVAKKPYCSLKYDESLGFGTLTSGFSESRTFVKLATFFALQSASNHDLIRATYYLQAAIIRSNQTADFPLLMNYLVQYAQNSIIFDCIQRSMSLDPKNSEHYLKLLSKVQSDSAKRILMGEIGFTCSGTRAANSAFWDEYHRRGQQFLFDFDDVARKQYTESNDGAPIDKRGRIVLAQLMSDSLPLLTVFDAIGEFKDGEQFKKALISLSKPPYNHKLSKQFSEMQLSNLPNLPNLDKHQKTQSALISLLSQVIQVKLKTGKYPADLSVFKNNTDPFNNGKPLQYAITEKSVKIWSFGEDKVDNNGTGSANGRDIIAEFVPQY